MTPVRRGGPVVLWTPEDVNLGNFLYHWLHAHAEQSAGRRVHALRTPAMEPWLASFPNAARLVTSRRDVPLRAQRVPGYWQRWGEAFTRQDLVRFVTDVLLDSPLRDEIAGVSHHGDVVVSVRRGDYYSVPRFRERYAFDVLDYVERAMALSAARAPVGEVHVVSDDIPWCRRHLDPLLRRFAGLVTYAGDASSPLHDLATLAASPRLILANSTFSYWGGYVSGVLHPDRHADVVAPWFHARFGDHLAAEQLDPSWTIVRESTNEWGLSDG